MSPRDDLIELFDYVWARFVERIGGLDEAEWGWTPVADKRVSVRWRVQHITDLLAADHNGPWLGVAPAPRADGSVPPASCEAAVAALEPAFQRWRESLQHTTDHSLGEKMGSIAEEFSDSTRYAFALHVVDELVHHSAEVALLRDLYEGRDANAG
jgi:hypothetical protein